MKVIKELPLFEIEIAGLHTFGKPSQPRVLWAGVQKTDSLLKLQGIVANLAHSAGFSKEDRAYQPHITIGKKWNHQEAGKAVQHYIEAYKQKKMQFYANQIVLYRIEPNHVPKYHVHEVYSLLGRGDYGPVD
ncbi:RNA 2',3'-cyclic phosphodiesterase [Virgibacillus halophilus]|uniref:RNA 2',3'-cyclic phosphodiesterase n=1 Tax=Tigheibacillus halophilus TaxID=361280 RepID=A0ABU5CDX6_9BACI|nr:RNA 2',3'-cyclic phosphodiesterase [Virgibacillus halophilus]